MHELTKPSWPACQTQIPKPPHACDPTEPQVPINSSEMEIPANQPRPAARDNGGGVPNRQHQREVLRKLLSYYETRGMLDKAEDALFEWLDTATRTRPKSDSPFTPASKLKPIKI